MRRAIFGAYRPHSNNNSMFLQGLEQDILSRADNPFPGAQQPVTLSAFLICLLAFIKKLAGLVSSAFRINIVTTFGFPSNKARDTQRKGCGLILSRCLGLPGCINPANP